MLQAVEKCAKEYDVTYKPELEKKRKQALDDELERQRVSPQDRLLFALVRTLDS